MNCESCGHENIDGARFCASCGIPLTHTSEGTWIGRLVGGRFRVVRVLGEGGMGVVYAAEQQMGSTVRRAAIKTLHPHLSKDPSVLARFHRECGTVAQLEHPNTIKVFDFGSDQDGTLYIAMEFVEGESLDKVIDREGALSPVRVVDILAQIGGALDEAHDQGIVHRDLKPENIVLGEKLGRKDFVKVLDFGIAARRESSDAGREQKLTQQGMVLGTPPYMSPEQFTGVELDRRSDIYSLGVMAYEMLTGELPFSAATPWQWATEHMTAQPFPIEQRPSGAGVPSSMRAAVMRALAKNPEDRPASAGEFVAILQRGLTAPGSLQTAATEAMQALPPGVGRRAPAPAVDVGGATGVLEAVPPGGALGRPGPGERAATPAAVPASTGGTQTEMASTPVIPVQRKSSPLVLALVGVLVVGGAGAALALRGGSSPAEPGAEEAATSASQPGAPSDSAPSGTSPSPGPAPAPPQDAVPSPENGSESAPPVPSAKATEPTPAPTGTSGPAPTPSTHPSGTQPSGAQSPRPAPGPTPTPTADCSSCPSLIRSGSWSKAASLFGSCSPADQKQCSAAARQELRAQVNAALAAHKCSQARSISAASGRMGVPPPGPLESAIQKCK